MPKLRYLLKKDRLVLTLLVKNEGDIILDNIFYHYARGVDKIIVTDNGSTDNTLNTLKNLQEKGLVHLETASLYNQDSIVNKMGEIAKNKYNATILIHADADEFWTPLKEKSLKKAFLKLNRLAVYVDRKDVLPTPECKSQPFPQKSLNIVTKHLYAEDVAKASLRTSLFLFWLPPKVMFSVRDELRRVGMGNHKLTDEDNVDITEDIVIYHFPFKSADRFKEKVKIAGESMKKIKTSKETWWHWKRWDRAYRKNALDKEIELLIPDMRKVPGLQSESFNYNEKILKIIKGNKKLLEVYEELKNMHTR
jgi:glycosyltransferase involved in cell wall biosynthesis